jgi:mono/diheme cytochrome c family protein
MSSTRRSIAAAVLSFSAALGVAGCRGERTAERPRQFFPDMDDQPRYKPQRETAFFVDGRTQRPAVAGTVAYGRAPVDTDDPAVASTAWGEAVAVERARLLGADPALYEGAADPAAAPETPEAWLASIPVGVDRELIELGRKNFNIYCATCHGYEGDGQGTVGVRWAAPVANLYDEKYRDRAQFTGRDGYIFHVARNGLYDPNGGLRMPGYGHALDEREAWGVVAYIRVLQAARGVSIDDQAIPAGERERIINSDGWESPVAGDGASTDSIAAGGGQ